MPERRAASSTFWAIPSAGAVSSRTVEEDRGQYDDERDVFWVSGAAFCCRAGVFRALGGFDADFFAHMEEIDLCWRMQLAGCRVRVVPPQRGLSPRRRHVADRLAVEGLLQPSQQPGDALQSAQRLRNGSSWHCCARGSTCWRPCRTSCRGVPTISGRYSAPGGTFSGGIRCCRTSGGRSKPQDGASRSISTPDRSSCVIFWVDGCSAK